MNYLSHFFAGAFLCNCIPHLACGLQGLSFPTPFAKPRGIGDSSPLVNFFWGLFNLLAGLALLTAHPVQIGLNAEFITVLAGAIALGVYISTHFAKVRAYKNKSKTSV